MNTKSANIRVRNIHLAGIDNAQISALQTVLQNLDGVNETILNGTILKVRYTFPETGFDLIWAIIKQHINNVPSQLRHALAANLEQIEREHLLSQRGWDVYVRDIYVASHLRETERRNKQPRKPWQQAKRPTTS